MRMLQNRMLRKTFRSKWDEMTGECRRLYTEGGALCSVVTKYHSGDQINETEMGEACGTYGEQRGAYRVLVRRPERKIPLGTPRPRLEYNIKMDLQEVGRGGMDWIAPAQNDRSHGACQRGNEHSGSTKCRRIPWNLRTYELLRKEFA